MHTSKTNPLITVQSGNGYKKLKCEHDGEPPTTPSCKPLSLLSFPFLLSSSSRGMGFRPHTAEKTS
jgi:hypothetical protein